MPAEGRENHLLKKGNSDAFFREKYLTKNIPRFPWDVHGCPAFFFILLNVVAELRIHERFFAIHTAFLTVFYP